MKIIDIVNERANIESPSFKDWFGDSIVVDSQGQPLICYHGTMKNFNNAFRPFTHFGTLQASTDIVNKKLCSGDPRYGKQKEKPALNSRLFPVYLKIENPYNFIDGGSNDTWSDVMLAMIKDNMITRDVLKAGWKKRIPENKRFIINTLTQYGVDGLVYTNAFEDAGSNSYVIFSPSQVWPVLQDEPDQ